MAVRKSGQRKTTAVQFERIIMQSVELCNEKQTQEPRRHVLHKYIGTTDLLFRFD